MKITTAGLLIVAAVQQGVAPPVRAQDQTPVVRELTLAWSLQGPWTGMAADESSGTTYALGRSGRGVEVDVTGQILREIQLLDDRGTVLRLARLPGTTLLTFSVWSQDLRAYDLNGNLLWTYPRATGIDDVWAADLDGDQADEVIVGYNGATGVHVLDGTGQLLWKSTAGGNVWHVSAGDVLGEGNSQVVTTSARGDVHVFSSDGKRRVDLNAGLYANMVRVRKLGVTDAAATIFVAGNPLDSRARRSVVVAALSGDGATKWRLDLSDEMEMVQSADAASTKPWLALGTQTGRVYVVDGIKGEVIGLVAGQGAAEVGWASTGIGEPPLLLVATRMSLNAFHVGAAN